MFPAILSHNQSRALSEMLGMGAHCSAGPGLKGGMEVNGKVWMVGEGTRRLVVVWKG
jgi:hypothetical protein